MTRRSLPQIGAQRNLLAHDFEGLYGEGMTTAANTNPRPLQSGDVCQYRKVGLARLVQHVDHGCWWTVEWIKAPKKYREAPADLAYCFVPGDRVEEVG